MPVRARPPDDITPLEFFTAWLPLQVEQDAERRARLGDTAARLVFEITDAGPDGTRFTIEVAGGRVQGRAGGHDAPDLALRLDIETWRALNRGDVSAPEALLRRRVYLSGDLVLALKLHVILG
jgi:putative sterol carrier protein